MGLFFLQAMFRFVGLLRFLAVALATLPLYACAPGASAIAETLRWARSGGQEKGDVRLAPGMRYLRVSAGKALAYMAFGYVEPGPNGPTEVWYSGDGETLKLRDGRIVGTTGLLTDWRDVRLPPLPRWSAVGATPVRYERERDEMPGYRFGTRDRVTLRAIDAPSNSRLIGHEARQLAWYEETAEALRAGDDRLPAARYAVRIDAEGETVLYGEQCLAPTLCLTWQRWPVTAGK